MLLPCHGVVQGSPYHSTLPTAVGAITSMDNSAGVVCVRLLRGRFSTAVGAGVTVGGVDCGVPLRVDARGSVSYKELISSEPLKPNWFCSHWYARDVMLVIIPLLRTPCCVDTAAPAFGIGGL